MAEMAEMWRKIHLGFEWVNEDIIGSKWGQMAHCWLKEVVIESEYWWF